MTDKEWMAEFDAYDEAVNKIKGMRNNLIAFENATFRKYTRVLDAHAKYLSSKKQTK